MRRRYRGVCFGSSSPRQSHLSWWGWSSSSMWFANVSSNASVPPLKGRRAAGSSAVAQLAAAAMRRGDVLDEPGTDTVAAGDPDDRRVLDLAGACVAAAAVTGSAVPPKLGVSAAR